MSKNTKRLFFILFIFALVYFRFLETSGWDLINKQAWDFPSFYYGAQASFDLGLTPYNQENWIIVESLYDGTLFAFLYAPPAILFFRMLNYLPFESAKLLILALNHILTLLVLWLVLIKLLKRSHLSYIFASAIVLIFNYSPLAATIRLGQINLIVLALILIAWIGIKEKWHPAIIGISIALATILKFNPAILLVLLAFRRKYKSLAWALGILVLAFLASTFLLPKGIWADWIANVLTPGFGEVIRGLNPSATGNQGINGFTSRFFIGLDSRIVPLINNQILSKIVPLILAIGVVIATFYISFRSRSEKNITINQEFATYLTAMFLVTPIAWDHHLVFLIPTIFVVLINLTDDWEEIPKRSLWAIILAASIIIISFPFPFNLPSLRNGILPLLISSKFYAVLLIWVFLIKRSFSKIKAMPDGLKKRAVN